MGMACYIAAVTTTYVEKNSNQFGKYMLMTVMNNVLNLGDPDLILRQA